MTWSPPTSVAASLTGPAQVTVTWTNPGGTDWNDVWRARKGESGRGICIGSAIAAVTAELIPQQKIHPGMVRGLTRAPFGFRQDLHSIIEPQNELG